MPEPLPWPPVALVIGLAVAGLGWLIVRASGAQVHIARRLAGARGWSVAEVLALDDARRFPLRPIRVRGRARCADPIVDDNGDRLVARHQDVEVRLPSGWRRIETLRESRAFELYSQAGTLSLDAGQAAEPLVVIPRVWEGTLGELGAERSAAVARLINDPDPRLPARAVTRALSVVEPLLVLADVAPDAGGRPSLAPPRGGYVLCALELDEAMRLMGGPRRRQLLGGSLLVGLGILLAVAGSGAWLLASLGS